MGCNNNSGKNSATRLRRAFSKSRPKSKGSPAFNWVQNHLLWPIFAAGSLAFRGPELQDFFNPNRVTL